MEVTVTKIYTRKGDQGKTSLLSGGKVNKDHLRLEAYGTLDELNSVLGLFDSEPIPDDLRGELLWIQGALFSIGSHLADADGTLEVESPCPWNADRLEVWMDQLDADLEPLKAFILPGGTRAAAIAHVGRTVCRRCERRITALSVQDNKSLPKGMIAFINRLSDTLFVLARWLNHNAGIEDRVWKME
ncbi:MAG: cob(I)yrinic acid a,c-diamide adenosyltransferase [bacterium]|nr:cob(I)yrinic acid a,c-diamide adenosyltransferase [bacterium]